MLCHAIEAGVLAVMARRRGCTLLHTWCVLGLVWGPEEMLSDSAAVCTHPSLECHLSHLAGWVSIACLRTFTHTCSGWVFIAVLCGYGGIYSLNLETAKRDARKAGRALKGKQVQ